MDPFKTQDDPSRAPDAGPSAPTATGNDVVDQDAMDLDRPDLADSLSRMADSLSRMYLENATATPLPTSPPLASPTSDQTSSRPYLSASNQNWSRPFLPTSNQTLSRPSVPTSHQTSSHLSLRQQSVPSIPSSDYLRPESRESIPALQIRQSTLPLGLAPGNNLPSSPEDSSRRSSAMLPPQSPTAASIAAEHFQKEVDRHQAVDLGSKTLVVIHDNCYGHRFARPQTSKSQVRLQDIVERPERLRACVNGVAAAYVRVGRRHEGEAFAPRPDLDLDSLPTPFQILKSSRSLSLADKAVTDVHGTAWMDTLKDDLCEHAEERLAMGGNELEPSHGDSSEKLNLNEGDLYLCSESANAFQSALGGVCDGIDGVFGPGPTTRAFVCIRPPGHHCSDDKPSGFCWINNVHVGISYAASQHGLTHAAILDFDLHHGDGSQEITWEHNLKLKVPAGNPDRRSPYQKVPIGYYSVHDILSFPCEGGDMGKISNASVCVGAHGQSIWNVHLEPYATETHFWKAYRHKYLVLINKARAFLKKHHARLARSQDGPPPKSAIFISAGFDASEHEDTGMQRHGVNVLTEFYAQFTADVVRMSQESGLGVDGRVISVLEGGYSDRALTSGVLSHLAGLSATSPEPTPPRPSVVFHAVKPEPVEKRYDPKWWSLDNLMELEALVDADSSAPTFLNPTRSSSARMVAPTQDRMGSSPYPGLQPGLSPLPDVGWAVAAHELSKILIPSGRQTMSHLPRELNAAATRVRRQRVQQEKERERLQRQGGFDGAADVDIVPPPPPTPVDTKRQLRTRKAKSPAPVSPRPATPRQQAMRKNRRKTVDGNDLPNASRESSPSVDASRRKSATSVTTGDTLGRTASDPPANPQNYQATSARKTSGSRQGTPKRSASPRKAPPVPKVPPTFLPSKLSDEVPRLQDPSAQDDVENVSSGLRKIKLVMPSPEEHAAREKKVTDELKQVAEAK